MKFSTKLMLRKIKGNIGQEYLPIILPKTTKLLIKYLKKAEPAKVLEIGTGIGYSTCCILSTLPRCHVTCVEKDEMRLSRAIYNFRKYGFFDRICAINGDAKQALFSIDNKFDFIFLDSDESQYIDFLPELNRLLKEGGILFADNIAIKYLYDGDEIHMQEREDKIVKKYLKAVQQMPFETKIYNIESGIAVTKKVKEMSLTSSKKKNLIKKTNKGKNKKGFKSRSKNKQDVKTPVKK